MITLRETLRQLSAARRRKRYFLAKYGPTRYYGGAGGTMSPRQSEIALRVMLRVERRHRQVALLLQVQGPTCYICDEAFSETCPPSRDHVWPWSRGGRDHRNLLLACKPCNEEKADRDPTRRELARLAEVNARLDEIDYGPEALAG